MDSVRHDDAWFVLLSAYADDECDPDERKQVQDHLGTCPGCRQWLEQVKADGEAFAGALTSSARGIDLTERIMEEVHKMPDPRKSEEPAGNGVVVQSAGRRRVSFSLIELLVIVMIVSVLAAMLFPVFARSREKARQTSCLSNIKQIVLAAHMYVGDWGVLPDAARWTDQLFPYTKNEQIFKCPMDKSKARASYAMNPRYSGMNPEDCPNADEVIIFYDADETSQPVARHNGGANCGYMDGHAKWLKGIPDQLSPASTLAPPSRNYGLADRLRIAYTAATTIWVKSIHTAMVGAETAVAKRGGFILVSTIQAEFEPYSGEIVCRVPTEQVTSTVNDLAKLGWVANREIRGENLTQRYLSTTREVGVQRERQERLEETVDSAAEKKHVVQLEEKLAQAESTEGAAHSELYGIADRTTLATIAATLTQRDRDEKQPAPLVGTWRSVLTALSSTGTRILQVGMWLLAFVWIWAPLGWLGVHLWKRSHHQATTG